jgi:hypothetical protein
MDFQVLGLPFDRCVMYTIQSIRFARRDSSNVNQGLEFDARTSMT